MYHIRKTKTSSGATAVQVVQYDNRKMVVSCHIGSAHTPKELQKLQELARIWIERFSRQQSLLPEDKASDLISIKKCRYLGFHYHFLKEILDQIFIRFQFHKIQNALLLDLVMMRIIQPASKLESLELIKDFFGIRHSRKHFYELVSKRAALKDMAGENIVALSKEELDFNFSFVFYDVTTLYFETFDSDELRKQGFSKDGKQNQPQILIGLVVSPDGFPMAYEIFEGNKFEGHTLIPVIHAFKKKHSISTLTVVADAAMISFENVKALKESNLKYIVGARKGNLSFTTIKSINEKLKQRDKATCRIQTNHGALIASFSLKRYKKDKYEMDKQLDKAEDYLKNPSKVFKRTKFLKSKDKLGYEINTELKEKTELLLGIKGYYTNLEDEVCDTDIIDHYHNLWHVEQAFRIAKNDLKMRPIYHFKKDAIEAHILICFMALAISKYMEIKTGKSIKAIIKLLKRVIDARILNTITDEEIIMRSEIPNELKEILSKLGLSY